ncbi:MAG: hypothetical protein RLZZ450_5529 [Pseudomonadota bacterium]|jgi:hypothetical protein
MKDWCASVIVAVFMASGCGADAAQEGDDTGTVRAGAEGVSEAGSELPTEGGVAPIVPVVSTTSDAAVPGQAPTGPSDGGPGTVQTPGTIGRQDGGQLGAPLSDPAAPPSPTVSEVIDSVGFDQSKGGFPIPVLLFHGGYASFNVEQIVKPIDIAYDVVEHPSAWPTWRRDAMGIALKYTNDWTPLMYKYECTSLAKGTTLAGTFQRRTDTVIGSEAAVQAIQRYRFAANGTFETCKVTKTAIVALGRISTEREPLHGTYEIDGYKIRFVYSDGTSATLPFFYDPMRPTRVWVGREPFPNPTTVDAAICVDP